MFNPGDRVLYRTKWGGLLHGVVTHFEASTLVYTVHFDDLPRLDWRLFAEADLVPEVTFLDEVPF